MEQLQQLKAIGLRTFENQFSAPEGGMSVALDITVDRPDIIETVRAHVTGDIGTVPTNGTVAITQVNTNLVAAQAIRANGPISAAGKQVYVLPNSILPGAWVILSERYFQNGVVGQQTIAGPFAADNKLDCFYMNGNVYISSDAGVFRWENPGDTTVRRYGAGMPRGAQFSVQGGPVGNITLPGFGAVRYRHVFGRKDTHNNLVLGEPSPAYVYFNNGAGAFTIGESVLVLGRGLEPGDIVQLYRSEITTGLLNTPTLPTDELQLVLEYVFTAADIQAGGFVTLNDKCPEGARGAFLYTNQNSGQGATQMNARPPQAACATSFKNVAWYANTTTQKSITIQLLDVSSWINGTTLSISNGTTTYTYTNGAAVTNAQINQVALQIAQAINQSGGANNNPDLYAYVDVVNWSTTPTASVSASVVIQTLGKGSDSGGTWTVTLGGAGPPSAQSTSPVLTTAGTNRTLTSDDGPNRLYFSKPGQPEHVPVTNFIEVGNKSDAIVAIAGLRDSLFVFKAQDGVFRVTGTSIADLRIEAFDPTVLITQPNSVGKAGNKLFLACNKGIVWLSESGVHQPPASRAIEGDVLQLCANPNVGVAFVGRADEAERKYSFIANGTVFYQYNYELDAWTKRSTPLPGTSYIQCMTSGPVGAPGVSGQLSDRFVLGDNNSANVWDIIPPADANPTRYIALPQFAYVVIDGNNPGLKKRFNDVSIVTTGSTVTALNVGFNTETTTVVETVNVTGLSSPYVVRLQVPRSCSYASQLTLTVSAVNSGEYLKVSGVSVTTEGVTTRTTR